MKEFPIIRRNGDVYIFQVDDEDYDRVIEAGPWRVCPGHRTVYACRVHANTTQKLHRFILGDTCEGKHVDHIDGNGLNNQRSNLRTATNAENGRNRRCQAGSSGLKGVSWHVVSQRWRAQIQLAGVKHHLGMFDTKEEAHAAYCEAAARLHGEFARFK